MAAENAPSYCDPERILGRLKRMLNARTAWDELPEWGHIYREGGRIRTLALPVPDFMWTQVGDPKRLLYGFRRLLAEPASAEEHQAGLELRGSVPPDFVGMYLRTEGWAPPQRQAKELFRRNQAGGSVPRFEELEGRRELRQVTAVDLTGRAYMAVQHRDDMALEGGYEDFSAAAEGQAPRVAGSIPEVLKEIMEVILTPTGCA